MLGSLMYLVVWTRPDLAKRCATLGQYTHNPTLEHESNMRRIFAYLKGTVHMVIKYQGSFPAELEIILLGFVGFTYTAYADNL